MSRFICIVACHTGERYYAKGDIVEADAAPVASYFAEIADAADPRRPGPSQNLVDLDGTTYLPGVGWDDLNFTATGINPPGAASDPARDTTTGLLSFSGTADNVIAGVAQMKHSWAVGTAVVPHLHVKWANANAGASSWKLQYKAYAAVGDVPADYTEITVSASSPGANKAGIISFGRIAMDGLGPSAHVEWIITRLGSSDAYASAITLTDVDFHYLIDSIGSGRELEK